jgi:hypothetical protein
MFWNALLLVVFCVALPIFAGMLREGASPKELGQFVTSQWGMTIFFPIGMVLFVIWLLEYRP